MEIWVQTMVKNEAKWLWYSVTSVINHVDKLLLWDTGSTDGSLEIEKELVKKYSDKITYRKRDLASAEDFTKVRQEMLNETKSDWFLMLDGDEIWWEESIKTFVRTINESADLESIVVPTLNLVGDIFHYQDKSAGNYHLAGRVGHYNLRGINRLIPGLHSQGVHGVWGWADRDGKMIQDRDSNKIKFIDAPYLHATNIERSKNDREVIKRSKKLKYEIGKSFPLDFYYPEAFFKDRPNIIPSLWNTMSGSFKLRSSFETPIRKIKRTVWKGKAGY